MSFLVELKCPEHGLERFKVKIIKKFNVNSKLIRPKYRTRPKYELSGLVIGRNVDYNEARDYLVQYYRETGLIHKILGIRLQL